MTAEKMPDSDGTAPRPVRLLRTVIGRDRSEPSAAAASADPDPARDVALRARGGDLDAFRTIVEMFQDRVMRVMVSVLRCDRALAEDLSQEVFLRVWKGLPTFGGEVRFLAWLHTIASNVAISEYRRRRAQKRDKTTLSIDQPLAGTDDLYLTPAGREQAPPDRAHHQEFLVRVRSCVQQLPDEFRAAVVLRDMESLSYDEIAVVLDLPIGTVRSRIHRGRLLLQDMLQEWQP